MARVESPRLLAGAIVLSLAFGSIHAFSVLMAPLERALSASRGEVSLGYSLAIASLTAGVFAAPLVMRLPPAIMAVAAGLAAGLGLAIAAMPSLVLFLAGYGLIFGFANGVSYSLFLNRAAAAMPEAPGWAAGIVTAAYGLGAALFAQGLATGLAQQPVASVLTALAAIVAAAALAGALMFRGSAFTTPPVADADAAETPRQVIWLWAIYLLGAFGGLMVIAHAAGIAGGSPLAPVVVALGNIAGSLAGGPLAQRLRTGVALAAPLAAAAMAMAALIALPALALVALAACGAAYGALIAAVPVVIGREFGQARFAAAFGRVFTAWGLAGLLAPAAAGALFDRQGSYTLAIALALTAALAGAILALAQPGLGRK